MGVSPLEGAVHCRGKTGLGGGVSREGHTGWEQSQVAEVSGR